MRGPTMFNTIAHCTTVYYYYHVLRTVAEIRATGNHDPVERDFVDFKTKFFTMWGLAAQLLFFVVCVLHDVTRLFPATNPVRRTAQSLRDLVLTAVAGPMAVTVTVMFWGLFSLDRELVMPAALDAIIPSWLNHCMHSFVLVLLVVQLLAEPHHLPPLGLSLSIALIVNVSYLYIFFTEYAKSGRWIYPVFGVLDWPGRLALIGLTVLMFLAQVVLMRAAVRARWGEAIVNKVHRKRKD